VKTAILRSDRYRGLTNGQSPRLIPDERDRHDDSEQHGSGTDDQTDE
jgi:hypothetical protein